MTSSYEEMAASLRAAYTGAAIAPLRPGLAPDDADGAYAVQRLNTRAWLESGRRIIGHKVGLTSKAVQRQLGVDRPDFGVLFEDMQLPDGGVLDLSRTKQPRVEAEVAFVLSEDLDDAAATADRVAASVGFVFPALEIVDSRIADWAITFADTVADNGSSAFFVLGKEASALGGLDLYSCGMVLEINGEVVSVGAGAACLSHPLESAAWLVRTLSAAGEPLRAGQVILAGALGPMVPLSPGDRVAATIGGLGACGFVVSGDAA